MIQEHERAILTTDIPEQGLQAGDVGTVIHVYSDGAAYEIEFLALDGRMLDAVTVEADQVRPVGRRDMLHVRELPADSQLASPFDLIFADRAEAEWGLDFLRKTLDSLNAGVNAYRPCVLTLPKNHKKRLLRFNFGPWLLLDFCGPASQYGKRINLALLRDGFAIDPRKLWFVFNHPHDKRGVAIYHFTWAEIRSMDNTLAEHYEVSMHYIGELFAHWQGSPYRLAHQPQIFAGVYDPTVRAPMLAHGLDPFFGNLPDNGIITSEV